MSGFVSESINPSPRIVLLGNGELAVENSRGICEFTAEGITLRTSIGALVICGENLSILCADDKKVTVIGKICSISYV